MRRLTTIALAGTIAALSVTARPAPVRAQNDWGIMDLGPAQKNKPNSGSQPNKQSQQVKQQKNKECNDKANQQNLRGNDRQRFLRDCMSN